MSMPIIAFTMPGSGNKVAEKKKKTSYVTSLIQWFQLKKYQYEVTFSLYMLTSTEKFIFNFILFLLVSMLVTAATLYLPTHLAVIFNRMSYYINGESAYNTTADEAIAIAKEGLAYTSNAIKAGITPTAESARAMLKEL